MSTTAIIVPKHLNSVTVPAPKRSEIIEALAIRKREQLIDQKLKQDAAIEKAKKAFDESILCDIRSSTTIEPDSVGWNRLYIDGSRTDQIESVYGRLIAKPSAMTKNLHRSFLRLTNDPEYIKRIPDLHEVKKSIADVLNGGPQSERVRKLLDDKQSSKALDTMLAALDKQASSEVSQA